ncbi:MAG: hypothetical protein ABIH23_16380 [bacterium]
MLKINDAENIIEIPRLIGPGQAIAERLDHFKVKMFRIDVFPVPHIEITLARATEVGEVGGPVHQFLIKGEQAEAIIDKGKFEKFIDHLEDMAEAKCPIKCKKKIKP